MDFLTVIDKLTVTLWGIVNPISILFSVIEYGNIKYIKIYLHIWMFFSFSSKLLLAEDGLNFVHRSNGKNTV